jgi:hypothetical protein
MSVCPLINLWPEHDGVKAVFWTSILELYVLNFCYRTGYFDSGFSWISSIPPDKCWDIVSQLGLKHFVLNNLQFIILPPYWLMLYGLDVVNDIVCK